MSFQPKPILGGQCSFCDGHIVALVKNGLFMVALCSHCQMQYYDPRIGMTLSDVLFAQFWGQEIMQWSDPPPTKCTRCESDRMRLDRSSDWENYRNAVDVYHFKYCQDCLQVAHAVKCVQ